MSVKHVKDYYFQVCNDYKDLLVEIKDLEEAVSNNLVFPEQLDAIKAQLEVLKANYERITYIMFLLDMPNKKEKQKRYIDMTKPMLSKLPQSATLEGIKEENKQVLKAFNENIKQLGN